MLHLLIYYKMTTWQTSPYRLGMEVAIQNRTSHIRLFKIEKTLQWAEWYISYKVEESIVNNMKKNPEIDFENQLPHR